MDCPHCTKSIHVEWSELDLGNDHELSFGLRSSKCPACKRGILVLRTTDRATVGDTGATIEIDGADRHIFVHPRAPARAPIHEAVPTELKSDYQEACLVLADSPKASAALSRRCLQHVLREKAGAKASNLSAEIDSAIPRLPTHLAEAIDAVRNIGNFAAHPVKSESTGEVVGVEVGEAEWLLDTLEGLFDYYFAQPAVLQAKRDALNKKLADAKKPELKSAATDAAG